MESQETIEEKTYSSGEVCNILNEKKYNIIYIEKALGLSISRDKLSHKIYKDKDIEILKKAKTLKSENGYSYEAIKKKLFPSTTDENNFVDREEEIIPPKEIVFPYTQQPENKNSSNELNPEHLKELMVEVINDRVEEILSQKFDVLKSYIENEFQYLRKQNTDMKTKMELDMEKCNAEISIKIDSLKHSMERGKKGFFR